MFQIQEAARHIGLRKIMIEGIQTHLRTLHISDAAPILDAMAAIPRHAFLPIGIEDAAYSLAPVLIERDQTMSSPITVALQTYYLRPEKTDRVLEIGTGSGYQATVLSQLVHKIHTIERHRPLYTATSTLLQKFQLNNVHCILGDGYEGYINYAPYDKIIITCGADHIPQALVNQLKEGGILLAPINHPDGGQEMIRLFKLPDHSTYEESLGKFNFVPMIGGIE